MVKYNLITGNSIVATRRAGGAESGVQSSFPRLCIHTIEQDTFGVLIVWELFGNFKPWYKMTKQKKLQF